MQGCVGTPEVSVTILAKEKQTDGEWMRTWIGGWLGDRQTDVNMDEWISRWIRMDGWVQMLEAWFVTFQREAKTLPG